MEEKELEDRIRIAMPPLRRLGDLLIMRNVDFDLRAVATSLVRLPKNQQLRVQVQDPAVAGEYWRWGLHGTGFYPALKIIEEGFVGSVCHDRYSRRTHQIEELVYTHTEGTRDKAWFYCKDKEPLASSLPLSMFASSAQSRQETRTGATKKGRGPGCRIRQHRWLSFSKPFKGWWEPQRKTQSFWITAARRTLLLCRSGCVG